MLSPTKLLESPYTAGLDKEYVLEPVAVGTPLAEAPLQMTELLNVGDASASYRVETRAIKRVQDSQGHGVPVRSPAWRRCEVGVLCFLYSTTSSTNNKCHERLALSWYSPYWTAL